MHPSTFLTSLLQPCSLLICVCSFLTSPYRSLCLLFSVCGILHLWTVENGEIEMRPQWFWDLKWLSENSHRLTKVQWRAEGRCLMLEVSGLSVCTYVTTCLSHHCVQPWTRIVIKQQLEPWAFKNVHKLDYWMFSSLGYIFLCSVTTHSFPSITCYVSANTFLLWSFDSPVPTQGG